MSTTRVFRAPWVLAGPDELVADGGLVVRAGRVVRLLRGAAEVRRAVALLDGEQAIDLEDVIVPGFVDAHAHLELTGVVSPFESLEQGGEGFVGWVGGILRGRGSKTRSELEADARRGARALLASGTTTVGDIDSTGAVGCLESAARPRLVRHVELLDAQDPTRSAGELRRWRSSMEGERGSDPTLTSGVSPHAPLTVSPRLLAAIGRRLRARPQPVVVHWAETLEERLYLSEGSGPFADVLGASPRRAGLELLEEAQLLGPRTALVHGNLPEVGDWERIAQRGATLVHCPGSHLFFGRPPFALDEARAAGVRVALGTDSRASNETLDMRREMRLLMEGHPDLAPAEVLRMATENGARALSLAGVVGTLGPGAWADFTAQAVSGRDPDGILEQLARGASSIAGTWVAGEPRSTGAKSGGAPGCADRPDPAGERGAELERRPPGGQE